MLWIYKKYYGLSKPKYKKNVDPNKIQVLPLSILEHIKAGIIKDICKIIIWEGDWIGVSSSKLSKICNN